MEIQGATVLITGATRGIGLALTQRLLGDGAQVIVHGRDPDRLSRLQGSCGGAVATVCADLARRDELDALVGMLPKKHPSLSVIINNAGVQCSANLAAGTTRLSDMRNEIAVNFDAVVTLSVGLLPHLAQQPEGTVVNLTSGLALAPKASAPVYCATKAAVRTFTRALRYQCEDSAPHLNVVDVILPLVDTDMTRGRGAGKLPAEVAAAAVVEALRAERREVWVGKAALLPMLMRLAPGLAYAALRRS
jgi:uncharacterized oxidoreductase